MLAGDGLGVSLRVYFCHMSSVPQDRPGKCARLKKKNKKKRLYDYMKSLNNSFHNKSICC